jgi:hypothetical protein
MCGNALRKVEEELASSGNSRAHDALRGLMASYPNVPVRRRKPGDIYRWLQHSAILQGIF